MKAYRTRYRVPSPVPRLRRAGAQALHQGRALEPWRVGVHVLRCNARVVERGRQLLRVLDVDAKRDRAAALEVLFALPHDVPSNRHRPPAQLCVVVVAARTLYAAHVDYGLHSLQHRHHQKAQFDELRRARAVHHTREGHQRLPVQPERRRRHPQQPGVRVQPQHRLVLRRGRVVSLVHHDVRERAVVHVQPAAECLDRTNLGKHVSRPDRALLYLRRGCAPAGGATGSLCGCP